MCVCVCAWVVGYSKSTTRSSFAHPQISDLQISKIQAETDGQLTFKRGVGANGQKQELIITPRNYVLILGCIGSCGCLMSRMTFLPRGEDVKNQSIQVMSKPKECKYGSGLKMFYSKMRSFCFLGVPQVSIGWFISWKIPSTSLNYWGYPQVRKPPNNMETTSRHDAAQELIRYQVYHWNNPSHEFIIIEFKSRNDKKNITNFQLIDGR